MDVAAFLDMHLFTSRIFDFADFCLFFHDPLI